MGAIGQTFAFVLLLVLPVLQGTDTTKKVRNADIDCEDNQIMVPLKEPHDGITSARFKCVNVTDTENGNESSINCGCVWLDKCPSLFKKHSNNTVYVAGIDVQPRVVLYKCCWSDRFNYDLELCNTMKKGDQMPALINDGENTTIVNHIRNSQTEYTICNATANDQPYCLAPDWSRGVTNDASWVVGLVLGLVFIPGTCTAITPVLDGLTITYDQEPNTVGKYPLDTIATYTCAADTQLLTIPPALLTEFSATCESVAEGFVSSIDSTSIAVDNQPICCTVQYDDCSDGSACCFGSMNVGDNDAVCLTANDGTARCSVGSDANACSTVDSIEECAHNLICSGTICNKYCVPIVTATFTVGYDPAMLVVSSTDGDIDVILDETVATLTCPVGSQLPYDTEYTATCTNGAWVYNPATEPICCRAQYENCTDASIPCCDNSPVNPDSVNDGMCITATDNVKRCSVGDVADACTDQSECELQTFQTPLLTICAKNKCMVCLTEGSEYCYTISSVGATFPVAITNCEDAGGKLATIPDQSINTLLHDMAVSASREVVYFGFRRVDGGQWEWVDGRSVTYTNWNTDPAQPSNTTAANNCAVMWTTYSTFAVGWTGEWDDNAPSCSTGPTVYFCQFKI